MKQQNIEEHEI